MNKKSLIIFLIGAIVGALFVGGFYYLGKSQMGAEKSSTQKDGSVPTNTQVNQEAVIEGSLSFPSEGIPESLVVCAETLQMQKVKCVSERILNDKYTYGIGYMLNIEPGTYYIYATLDENNPEQKAYYSEAVICGLSVECTDHSPIPVTTSPGERKENIDPGDWYAN